jgi:hypothetical protein
MRSLVVLVSALVIGPSMAASQEDQAPKPEQRPVLVDDVPQGTNWVANARTRTYYRVGCPITASIPLADKLYYKSEASLQSAGFTKSDACNVSGAVSPSQPEPGVAAPAAEPSPAAANGPQQQASKSKDVKHSRKGFWFNFGLGYGTLGCQDCTSREDGLSGGIALGGSVSQKVSLGGGTNGWTKSENGATLTVSTLTAVIRFYPSATGGFFLLGGLGVGAIREEVSGFGSETQTGYGALFGLGYDIRVGKSVSLTPFWNGFGAITTDADANVGQIGLGLTVH